MNKRFTIDGSNALEQRLGALCSEVARQVSGIIPAAKLQGIVLGGGYGRGEGGVLNTETGDEPYNDLEFYVFLRGNRLINQRRYESALNDLANQLSLDAGIHVEFKCDSIQRFKHTTVSMFSYDLVAGHQSVCGEPNIFQSCEHHLDARLIPLSEATRLLFNRCSGLLLVREKLSRQNVCGADIWSAAANDARHRFGIDRPDGASPSAVDATLCRRTPNDGTYQLRSVSTDDADFIGRNLAKAKLALGDAVLVVCGDYHWSCRERNRRLAQLSVSELPPQFSEIKKLHAEGIEFKLHPCRSSGAADHFERAYRELSRLCSELWLWLESIRLQEPFFTPRDYSLYPANKCPESSVWRNCLLNLRTFGVKSINDALAWRYPRERLLNALPLLLWESKTPAEPTLQRLIQKQLHTAASDWAGWVAAYKSIWPNYG